MSALKLREGFKVGLITLVLVLMLLAEPVLAAEKGSRGGGGRGGGSNRGSQESQPSSSAPRVQPETRGGASNTPGTNSSTVTSRPGNRQPERVVTSSQSTPVAPPAPQPSPVTSNPQPRSTGSSRHITQEQPTISNSVSFVRTLPAGGSTTEGRPSGTPSAPREKNQINEDKTHRIGSSIGKEAPPASAVEKQPSVSSDSPGGRGRAGRADSSVSENKPSSAAAEKQTSGVLQDVRRASASGRAGSDRTVRIGSSNNDEGPSVSADAKPPVISLSKTSRIASPIGKGKGSGRVRERRSSTDLNKPVGTGEAGSVRGPIGTENSSVSVDDSSRQAEPGRRSNRADSQRILRTDKKSPVPDATGDGSRGHKVDASEKVQETQDARHKTQGSEQGPGQIDRGPAGSISSRRAAENQKAVIDKFDGDKTRIRRSERVGSSRVVYDDCPELISHSRHHEYIYIDRHRQVCHRTIRPEYYFSVYYNRGPCWTFRYVYPYYHRKYVFVSLGGYWPIEYTSVRYYWYGYHPYIWCGYYPIPYEVQGDTYNYYTYNYYTYNYPGGEAGTTATAGPSETVNYIKPVDQNTFADVREKLAKQQAAKPDQETPADVYFDEAVKAFEVNDYGTAIEKFAKAMEFAPDDMILPFAYAQALLADERYVESAKVLRAALAKVSPEKEGVFYPRGLYSSDEILFEQIDRLEEKAKLYSFDADLQLLLGYQLLGIGELDEAAGPLRLASQDLENAAAAAMLLNVLEKVRANSTSQNTD